MAHNTRPVAPARCCQRCGAMAGVAGAHRSSALCGYGAPFLVFSLPTESVECEELTKGVFYRWGLQSKACGGKVQASTFGDGGGALQGSAHGKVGPNRCGAERRTPVLGRRRSRSVTPGMAMKGVNLGIVSVFFEIMAQRPSIYRGFGRIISCACRALSPSSQIRLGFINPFDFIEISAGGISVSVMTRCGVGDDRRWAAIGSARPAGPNSAHGQIKLKKVFLIFKYFLNSKPI
jgi:hypothetical protein